MKKIFLSILFLGLGVMLFAQEQELAFLPKKNEVKLNLPTTIFGSFLEISYERIFAEDFSAGLSLGASLDGGDDYGYKFQATPFARWFFGGSSASMQKYAAGFFIEANASVFLGEEDMANSGSDTFDDEWGAGLGFGLGWKYVTKNNWAGEILLGLGKNFAAGEEVYPRIGVSIGKRF